ncbi:MAG: hypothetical protein GY950_07425 [bacterium]|nr:hypothetical protein [bacterium]
MNVIKHFLIIFAVLSILFCLNYPLNAQCNPIKFEEGTKIPINFGGVAKIGIINTDFGADGPKIWETSIPEESLENNECPLSKADIDAIREKVETVVGRSKIKAAWLDEDGKVIGYSGALMTFQLPGETKEKVCGESAGGGAAVTGAATHSPVTQTGSAQVQSSTSAGSGERPSEIGAEWNKWYQELEKGAAQKKKKFIMILFDEDLQPLEVSQDYAAVGDLIHVGLVRNTTDSVINVAVDYSPCALEPESPQLYIGDTFKMPGKQAGAETGVYYIQKFPPKRCFNQTVNITVTKKELSGAQRTETTKKGTYILQQYKRYRATLQLGVLFTDLHPLSFGLKNDGGTTAIYSKGPENTGPSYIASLVIYSFPRYLSSMFSSKEQFSGRDILHDNSFTDKIGAVLGVGLDKPGHRFSFGLSFELLYGINLVGVYEFVRMKELAAGVKVGDPFTGTVEEIPTSDFWDKKIVLGLSIDLRYVTALFTRQ